MILFRVSPAVVDTLFINASVKMIFRLRILYVEVSGRGEPSPVCRSGRNGTAVHKSYGGKLTVSRLRALAVREVPGGVAYGELSVGRAVPGAEAWSAEAFPHYDSCGYKIRYCSVPYQFGVCRHASGIDA